MPLNAGSLNRRVLVERRVVSRDAEGGEIVSWAPLTGNGMLWADPKLLNGTETIKSDARTASVKGSIRLRFRRDIDETCRVTYEGVVFEILAVLPDLRNREHVDLAVESGVTNG